jgi:hypothetical protein
MGGDDDDHERGTIGWKPALARVIPLAGNLSSKILAWTKALV